MRAFDVGEFVEVKPEVPFYGLPLFCVWKIKDVLPKHVYGRKAYFVQCGERAGIVWAGHVRKVRR